MLTISLIIERGDDEIELEVDGTVATIIKGRYSGPPEDCYPDEGGEVEILAIRFEGEPWDGELTASEEDNAAEMLRDLADAAREDDLAEAAYLRRMED